MSKSLKLIYLCVFIIFVSGGIYLVLETIELSKYKRDLKKGSFFPKSEFYSLDNVLVTLNSVENKTLILFFSPSCPHCKNVFDLMNKGSFADSLNVIAVSGANAVSIRSFARNYPKLETHFRYLRDENDVFVKNFGSSVVPNSFLYLDNHFVINIKGELSQRDLIKIKNSFSLINE